VYTFGSDFYGCLGVDEGEEEVTSPVCVPTFAALPVLEVSCGDNHVAALTRAGDVYTWGCGEFGRESSFGFFTRTVYDHANSYIHSP